jgi:hypothetical protein
MVVTTLIDTYLFGFIENAFKIKIDLREIIPSLNKALLLHKHSLLRNKAYVGYRFEDGLWEITKLMCSKINTEIEKNGLRIDL